MKNLERVFAMPFATVYPLYVNKVVRKGQSVDDLDTVIRWLTGFSDAELRRHIDANSSFADFFADAKLNPNAGLITGVICGVRVENIEDPLMQKIRYLDKIVDEVAAGKSMDKILRK